MSKTVPPVDANDDLDPARALLKRTKKQLRAMPIEFSEWVVASLAAWHAIVKEDQPDA